MTKKKPKELHKKDGRPTSMTPTTIGKLEDAFSKGFSDSQACIYANIHPSTLYEYCSKYPEFRERKENLKQNVNIIAKQNLYSKIVEGDETTSKWWLERKCKDEFSLRNELTGADGKELIPVVIKDDVE